MDGHLNVIDIIWCFHKRLGFSFVFHENKRQSDIDGQTFGLTVQLYDDNSLYESWLVTQMNEVSVTSHDRENVNFFFNNRQAVCTYNLTLSRMRATRPTVDLFYEIRYYSIFKKSVEMFQVPLKSDKNNGYLH